jgi:DNA-binding NarL/FixJ family response regulator
MTQLAQLSQQREADVAGLLLQGKSNKQIAASLNISVCAVEFHLSNIYSKLSVSSCTKAVLKLSHLELRESTGEELA